ncbi:uncharacterized protein K452DRAFT_78196 [Aplosporella prunicola CBS 121167]|uniref:Uncharacterized protein n=1 Tax=Aplosporella prunicola CBS 121167 TaxID=1176127 RepID=A0A6A6B3Y9_9PEZI|nr:uncharacterized protein K452DRAFT_78196 [Aplosporella prunicola CBS 121167]KAF2138932.1 hypothetical protein K452DRAFT_78196 [Aplosporella prunicola CBS 121167]
MSGRERGRQTTRKTRWADAPAWSETQYEKNWGEMNAWKVWKEARCDVHTCMRNRRELAGRRQEPCGCSGRAQHRVQSHGFSFLLRFAHLARGLLLAVCYLRLCPATCWETTRPAPFIQLLLCALISCISIHLSIPPSPSLHLPVWSAIKKEN